MSDATLTPPVSEADHSAGPDDAPVTLVEYGDYECPYCGMAHPIVKRAQRELGSQLRFVFRNFPLAEAHPHARLAAQAAEAAGAQGKFWEMHDMLFEHQDAPTRRRSGSTHKSSSATWRMADTRRACATTSGAA